jgi:menaquinone-9 beta-reductase
LGTGLADGVSPVAALRRYRRRHRQELLGHFLATSGFARAKALSPVERLMFSAATRDPEIASHVDAFAARLIRPARFLGPRAVGRALRVNAKGPAANGGPHGSATR